MTARALFLDRDGTIVEDTGYPDDPANVRLFPGVAPALAAAQVLGWRLFIISNQSGIGRGWVSFDAALAVQRRVAELFGEKGVRFDGFYFCPHAPDHGCSCRKPKPELIEQAARDHGIDLSQSITFGDKPSDVESGIRAGTRGFLVTPEKPLVKLLGELDLT